MVLMIHSSVYATLRARIKIIDQLKRASLRKTLLSEIKVSGVGTIASDTKLLRSMNSLPPPSDDDQSWFGKSNDHFDEKKC